MGMNNATTQGATQYTHTSYAAAMADLKKRARKGDETPAVWDAGNGWTARAHYCAWRKRIVHATTNTQGFTIV